MPSHPEALKFLLIIIPVGAIMFFQYTHGKNSLKQATGQWHHEDFYNLYIVKWFFSSLALAVFFIFSILSLAGYQGKEYPVDYEPSGTDIFFVLDLSNSMKAEDVKPSRIDAAKKMIRIICENPSKTRFGLAIYKGAGIKMVPLTEDTSAIINILEHLNPEIITSPGTNIQSGLEATIGSFTKNEERNKHIILFSDGEMQNEISEEFINKIVKEDVKIHCVGIGTSEGASIPVGGGKQLTNAAGQTVITKLSEKQLKQLSEKTGGTYYDASDSRALSHLYSIGGASAGTDKGYKIIRKENYSFFLLIALISLLLSKLIKVIKWKNLY